MVHSGSLIKHSNQSGDPTQVEDNVTKDSIEAPNTNVTSGIHNIADISYYSVLD